MRFVVGLVWALSAVHAHAAARTSYSLGTNLRVSLELPVHWIAITDIPLVPLALLELTSDAARAPVLRLQPLSEAMNFAPLAEEQAVYRAERKAWAGRQRAQIQEFSELEKFASSSTEAYRTGVRYLMGNEDLQQRDYYLRCGKRWIHAESLYLTSGSTVGAVLDGVIQGLHCE